MLYLPCSDDDAVGRGEARLREPERDAAELAREIRTIYIDDIDGTEAVETVTFALDGNQYEIDLNALHATALREALARYVEQGRVVNPVNGLTPGARGATSTRTTKTNKRGGVSRRNATIEEIEAIKASRRAR
jgi:hypothetical protein